jgi:hypothetical protein
MIYAIIDTSIWKSILINRGIDDPNLTAVHELAVTKKIIFLSCPALQREWEKHGKEEVVKIEADYNKKIKVKSLGDDVSTEEIEELEKIKQRLLKQVTLVDEIYARATPIPETDRVKAKVLDAQNAGKAPFHAKKKSINDALILFSALEFMNDKKDSKLFIVSSNHTDFSEPGITPHILHSDLTVQYPDVAVIYLVRLLDFIGQLRDLGIVVNKMRGFTKPVTNVIQVDKSVPLTRQVLDYLEKVFEGFSVLPKQLYAKHYPFLIGENTTLPEKAFQLFIDNEALYELFYQNYHSPTDNSFNRAEALEIAYFLRGNLVDHFVREDRTELELLVDNKERVCDCSLCRFRKHDIIGALETMERERVSGTITQRMRASYLFFITGDLLASVQISQDLLKDPSLSKTQRFLVHYNLVNLYWSLHRSFRIKGKEKDIAMSQLAEINIEKEKERSMHVGNQATVNWINDNTFYKKTLADVQRYNTKIRSLYHSKSSGSHNDSSKLLERFYVLTEFLERNGVLFYFSSQYDELSQSLTEGIFASYACREEMSGKINFFSDYLLEKLVFFSEPDLIRRYRRRYKLTTIKGDGNNGGVTPFLDRSHTLFQQSLSLKTKIVDKQDWDDTYFTDLYERIVLNCITLASILELSDTQINSFFEDLYSFLSVFHHVHPYKLTESIHFFVINKGAQMSDSLLKQLFRHYILKATEHTDGIMYTLSDLLERRKIKVSFTTGELDSLLSRVTDNTNNYQRDQDWDKICLLPAVLEGELERKVSLFIQTYVKGNFETEKFYKAAMYELTTPDLEEIRKYDDYVRQRLKITGKRISYMDQSFFHDTILDKYCNFYFKYNLIFPEDIRNSLVTLDSYYQWLLDMDNFDYSLYNPHWVKNHFSYFFKLRYRKSEVLRRHWLTAIKNNNGEPELMHYYIYTYDMPLIEDES